MKKSNEVIYRTDLAGWRLAPAYWARLEHGLAGINPALVNKSKKPNDDGELFFCVDKAVLRHVLTLLPRKPYKLMRNLALLSPENDHCFSIEALKEQWSLGNESESVRVISKSDMEELNDPRYFRWAPGLISFRSEVPESENLFLQRLDIALARL